MRGIIQAELTLVDNRLKNGTHHDRESAKETNSGWAGVDEGEGLRNVAGGGEATAQECERSH